MADNYQNTSTTTTHQFTKGMVKDLDPSLVGQDSWIHARNAVNNSHTGSLGDLGNEPGNFKCANYPYTFIGAIHIIAEKWAIFSTDNLDSEIGIFDDINCTYKPIVNDRCLNLQTSNLVSGDAKKNFDCTFSIYWDDGLNPSRQLNIDRPEYKVKPTKQLGTCNVPEYTTDLNCEKLRLSRLVITPTVTLRKALTGGSLPNGSYQAVIAYTVNQVRVTDYFTPSNAQSLFAHQNLQGSLEVDLSDLDTSYDEFELVVISYIGEKINAQKVGNYSTRQSRIFIDKLDERLEVVPFEYIPLQTPAYDRSDAMYSVADYLLRVGVYTKADFNYQPLANKILTKWVALEKPADYYAKGGNLTSYLRDERYVFYIRWIYNDGRKSASYVIPGPKAQSGDFTTIGGRDAYELKDGTETPPQAWQIRNTATMDTVDPYQTRFGTIVAEGDLGCWQSTEKYPDNSKEIWTDLCGKPIQIGRFPDNGLINRSGKNGTTINILGVRFENISHPVGFDGKPIESIVGYEILRASREGNKSIIAKGLFNNMAQYDIPGEITDRKGLYPNYPFNDLRTDPFLSKQRVKGGCEGKDYQEMGTFLRDVFTFHSPETSFRNPFLPTGEINIESEDTGTVTGYFEPVSRHPRHKLIRDFALYTAGVVGVGLGLIAIKGKKTTTWEGSRPFNLGYTAVGTSSGVSVGSGTVGPIQDLAGSAIVNASLVAPIGGGIGQAKTITLEGGALSQAPLPLRIAGSTFLFTYFLSQGAEEAIRIIRALLPFQQFAYQYNSYGFYTNSRAVPSGNRRRKILEANYLEPYLQEFTSNYRVNNLFRSRAVAIKLGDSLQDPSQVDNTRQTIGDRGMWSSPTTQFNSNTSAYYGSIKAQIDNQYGQLDALIQIPVSQGVQKTEPDLTKKYSSEPIFGGDQYITRYTEKNTMFYFNDWLFTQPDGTEFDYNLAYNVPYARYWINTQEYDTSKLMQPFLKTALGATAGAAIGGLFDQGNENSLGSIIGGIVGGAAGAALSLNDFKNAVLPNDYAHLDRNHGDCQTKISFGISDAYFYLFNSGVRDFFVESEINLEQRDYDEEAASRHYDYKSYTDLSSLFKSDIIKAGNNYKYDYSLSFSRLLHNFISWGNVLPRSYDPTVAEKCYSYYPNRIIYSLPQSTELKKDNWTAFLANNYKDFTTAITAVKNVNKTGAMIYFRYDSPVMFQGVDTLRTEGGIKITIGDGGLFNQPLQSVTNSDTQFEYGSCQNRWSIVGTPYGLFSMSQNQGKIFQYSGGLQEITREGNRWHFAQYLPSKLLQDFPAFEYDDNPVIGVGCMTSYDNTNEIVYFTKVDYQIKPQFLTRTVYKSGLDFIVDDGIPVKLGDPTYFDNASFTVSYDPKVKAFISFHDWIPEGSLASKNHVLTMKSGGIWRHNSRCDLFCNFYGVDYPFEVEIPATTGQEVTTLRSVEYILEAYVYSNNCRDSFHVLDANFDGAVVSNTEESSGLLKLTLQPRNDPFAANSYPLVNGAAMEVLFNKVENKYRLNMFFDLTRDRGEYTDREYPLWLTQPNGYVKDVNPQAINYSKNPLQRKKFRHYTNKLFLKKNKSGSTKLLFKVVNLKQLRSPR